MIAASKNCGKICGVHALDTLTFAGAFGTVGVGVNVGVGVIVGVGVGGGVYSGSPAVLPVTVAYCPHNQQVPDESGLLMIQ